jgi:hypothetical protein
MAVMALVIFFLSDPRKGVAEMARVVRRGGTIATYVWDMIGGGFPWEPIHAEMRELGIKPLLPPTMDVSRQNVLRELWAVAGLDAIELCEITVRRSFDSFEDFWGTTTQAASLQPTLARMASDDVQELKTRVRSRLKQDATGRVAYPARANAIRGQVPP